jgi:hypothetical protein
MTVFPGDRCTGSGGIASDFSEVTYSYDGTIISDVEHVISSGRHCTSCHAGLAVLRMPTSRPSDLYEPPSVNRHNFALHSVVL